MWGRVTTSRSPNLQAKLQAWSTSKERSFSTRRDPTARRKNCSMSQKSKGLGGRQRSPCMMAWPSLMPTTLRAAVDRHDRSGFHACRARSKATNVIVERCTFNRDHKLDGKCRAPYNTGKDFTESTCKNPNRIPLV